MSKQSIINGGRLKAFRKQNRLTQQQIAKEVNKVARSIGYWESGKVNIPEEVAKYLNRKYKLNLIVTEEQLTKYTKDQTQDVLALLTELSEELGVLQQKIQRAKLLL